MVPADYAEGYIDYTLNLTEKLERGEVSPNQYADERARLVGQGDFVGSVLAPLVEALFEKLRFSKK